MTVSVLIALTVVVLAVGLFIFRAIPGVRAYFNLRGKRLIICPETHTPEAVDVAAGEAAVGAFLSEPTLRLIECSRWPERQDCGQDCLQQIEIDPRTAWSGTLSRSGTKGRVACFAASRSARFITWITLQRCWVRTMQRPSGRNFARSSCPRLCRRTARSAGTAILRKRSAARTRNS